MGVGTTLSEWRAVMNLAWEPNLFKERFERQHNITQNTTANTSLCVQTYYSKSQTNSVKD